MSDPYDPTQEFPPMQIIFGGVVLVVLAFAVVFYIIQSSEAEQAPAASAPAPAAAAPAEAAAPAPAAPAPAAPAAPAPAGAK